MPKGNNRTRNNRGGRGVMEIARERPIAATAAAAGAAAAGLFLWSKRAQISEQLSGLSDQIGEWTDGMRSGERGGNFEAGDDTAGLAKTGSTGTRATTGRARSGGGGMTSSASGRGAQNSPTT